MVLLIQEISIAAAALLLGLVAGYLLNRWENRKSWHELRQKEASFQAEASREKEAILRESRLAANEEALKLREQAEKGLNSQRREISDTQARLTQRESLINSQMEALAAREERIAQAQQELVEQQTHLQQAQAELQKTLQKRRAELERIAALTEADARAQLLQEVEEEARRDAADLSRNLLETAKSEAEDQARRIISLAIQRYSASHTFETTTATVALSGDEMKGRIIGREGRNIRAFEAATGITVLIDDTPNAVVLSGFDPVRREVARESMHRLILDGRIHPTRIEEVVARVNQEMDETIEKAGEEAVFKTGLPPFHPHIVRTLGRLRFRQSYTQNILDHSIEVAHLTGLMAVELGLDISQAKRAGLLHDIGKAINHEVEGSHALIGAEFIKRYGESPAVVNGVASHHDEVDHEGPLGILVSAADAISASRPGARSETMSTYLKRLDDLEKIGRSFAGVEKCYAVQAGRELRIMVQPEKISDDQAATLARNIARKIEDELQYPGQIRLTIIRETRCIEFAK